MRKDFGTNILMAQAYFNGLLEKGKARQVVMSDSQEWVWDRDTYKAFTLTFETIGDASMQRAFAEEVASHGNKMDYSVFLVEQTPDRMTFRMVPSDALSYWFNIVVGFRNNTTDWQLYLKGNKDLAAYRDLLHRMEQGMDACLEKGTYPGKPVWQDCLDELTWHAQHGIPEARGEEETDDWTVVNTVMNEWKTFF